MTAKTKLEEAKMYLQEIISEKEDLKKLRNSTVSFLDRIHSIDEHMAQEVNKKLDLKLEGPHLYKKLSSIQNEKIITFLTWRNDFQKIFKSLNYMTILRNIRNRDHHQEELDFQFSFLVEPHDKRDFEKAIMMDCVMAGGKKFEKVSELLMLYEDVMQYNFKEWNSKREEKGFPLIKSNDDLINKICISFQKDSKSRTKPIPISDVCANVFQIMEIYVQDFYKTLQKLSKLDK